MSTYTQVTRVTAVGTYFFFNSGTYLTIRVYFHLGVYYIYYDMNLTIVRGECVQDA